MNSVKYMRKCNLVGSENEYEADPEMSNHANHTGSGNKDLIIMHSSIWALHNLI